MKTSVLNLEKHFDNFVNLIVRYTPHVVAAFLVLILGLWFIKRLSKIAAKAMEKKELDVSLRTFLKSLISIGLKVVLIITVAGMVGIGTTSFVTILGAAGLAVGLALQGSLSNFAGGVLVLIFKPFKVGDIVEMQGQAGTVKEIQIFNTILLTNDLKTVILPNGAVSNGTIVNFTRHGVLRGDVQVTIAASNDVDKVKQLLIEEMLKHEHILKSPLPEVAALKIADNAVTLSIKPFGLAENFAVINSDVVEIAKRVFDQHKIAAPIQQRIVHSAQIIS